MFFFGAATSAHQVEGGNSNDWSEWETGADLRGLHANKRGIETRAQRAARIAKDKDWPDYILKNYPNPLQLENYISGRASDHYNRFQEDFDVAKKLGHNAHRLSIEWSRVEPEEGKFNKKEIEHYREVVRTLCERDLEPFITLWHWTIPLWLRDKGGWAHKTSPFYFARYVQKIVSALPEVKFWVTLNEPNVYAGQGYWRGVWPPNIRSPFQYFIANRNLTEAHRKAYVAIKSINSRSEVGVAQNVIYFAKFPARLKRYLWNHRFFRSIRRFQDFVGINYYVSDRDTEENSEFLNWPIDPEGIYFVLREVSRYRKPIYILENGIADAEDQKRAKFIQDHLRYVVKARNEGVDVRGYFYWSLLDNFEWDKGFWPHFGLVEVNYKTMERKIRSSAWEYKKIIGGWTKVQ